VAEELLLEMKGINKNFGAVRALSDVDFHIFKNEIVGLVGDNGAGKSTLVKIISGVERADSGTIRYLGREVSIQSPDDAKQLGIETLYQNLALINNLDVVANLFLGRELVRRWPLGIVNVLRSGEMERQTTEILGRMKINLGSVREKVQVRSGGQL